MSDLPTIWHGTDEDGFVMLTALAHNCACEYDSAGARKRMCDPHNALINDQAWGDRLLFNRWLAQRLILEEFDECHDRATDD